MAPLPKRKHSVSRKNKRMFDRAKKLPEGVKCVTCGKLKLSHRVCQSCGN
ncbi:MAG: 50S ribosomal protein L32 [Candidatus Roizmanbacteria bacterium]